MSSYVNTALSHLESSLCQKALAKTVFSGGAGLEVGGLLITGSQGCGKSLLATALCRYLSVAPNLAYVTIVECKALHGMS